MKSLFLATVVLGLIGLAYMSPAYTVNTIKTMIPSDVPINSRPQIETSTVLTDPMLTSTTVMAPIEITEDATIVETTTVDIVSSQEPSFEETSSFSEEAINEETTTGEEINEESTASASEDSTSPLPNEIESSTEADMELNGMTTPISKIKKDLASLVRNSRGRYSLVMTTTISPASQIVNVDIITTTEATRLPVAPPTTTSESIADEIPAITTEELPVEETTVPSDLDETTPVADEETTSVEPAAESADQPPSSDVSVADESGEPSVTPGDDDDETGSTELELAILNVKSGRINV